MPAKTGDSLPGSIFIGPKISQDIQNLISARLRAGRGEYVPSCSTRLSTPISGRSLPPGESRPESGGSVTSLTAEGKSSIVTISEAGDVLLLVGDRLVKVMAIPQGGSPSRDRFFRFNRAALARMRRLQQKPPFEKGSVKVQE